MLQAQHILTHTDGSLSPTQPMVNNMMRASHGSLQPGSNKQPNRTVLDAAPANFVFPDHQKLDKSFKGETSTVSNTVLETWLNETLQDAQHLDIPGVITKPEHKNPISRYGIERHGLMNAGLSAEDVDRIYRALFVYSVGFFEHLKKVSANTKHNYQLLTALWKVFAVLLEYCCKTDYRLLICEVTAKHERETRELVQSYKEKIRERDGAMKTMKANMETMEENMDELAKEKEQEKQLRLKLEEEYMQNTKNHEEEVKLRLKFEGKFNNMQSEHRELTIHYGRTKTELEKASKELLDLAAEHRAYAQELKEYKKRATEQEGVIDSLKEWKENAEKELRKKNFLLESAQSAKAAANDKCDLFQYDVQDNHKEINDLQIQLEVKATEIRHLKGVVDALKLEKEEFDASR